MIYGLILILGIIVIGIYWAIFLDDKYKGLPMHIDAKPDKMVKKINPKHIVAKSEPSHKGKHHDTKN